MPSDALCATFTDAAGSEGQNATLSDCFLQGTWGRQVAQEGINWEELRVPVAAMKAWGIKVKRGSSGCPRWQ